VRVQRVLHGHMEHEVPIFEQILAAERVFHNLDPAIGQGDVVAADIDRIVLQRL